MTAPLIAILACFVVFGAIGGGAWAVRARLQSSEGFTWGTPTSRHRWISISIAVLPPLLVVATYIESQYHQRALIDDGIVRGDGTVAFPLLTFLVMFFGGLAAAIVRSQDRPMPDQEVPSTTRPSVATCHELCDSP